jgi:hypothetical protein
MKLRKVAECPFSVAQEYATMFLGKEPWSIVAWRLGRLRFVVPGRAWTVARPDLTEPGTPHDELLVTWQSALPFIPPLRIIIRFRIAWLTTAITVEGQGLPNGFTHLVLEDLLERLSRYLEEEERQYRRDHPPALGPVRVPQSFFEESETAIRTRRDPREPAMTGAQVN